jgi:hypothetical protein
MQWGYLQGFTVEPLNLIKTMRFKDVGPGTEFKSQLKHG